MNNLDTQTVKGIVGEKFYFFKATKISCIKTEAWKVDGIKVTIYPGSKRPSKDIIQLNPWNVGRCKKDLKFIIQISLRISTGKLW